MISRDINTIEKDGYICTAGLIGYGLSELRVSIKSDGYKSIITEIISAAASYACDQRVALNPGEKIALMSWIFEIHDEEGFLELYELDSTGENFVKGAAFAAELVDAQTHICDEMSVSPLFSVTSQMVAVSDGVLLGESSIEGVRYPSPDHMSGWWITTGSYDGNINNLKTVHMGHVIASRNDVAAFLALPYGYRFRIDGETHVWFDDGALN